jgi:hypothetical protein
MTDFVNLKLTQSFKVAHKNRVYMCVHINECLYVYKYVFLKKIYARLDPVKLQQLAGRD